MLSWKLCGGSRARSGAISSYGSWGSITETAEGEGWEVDRGRKSMHGLGRLVWRSFVVVLIRTNVMAVMLGSPQDSTSAGVSKGPGRSMAISV